MTKLLLDLFDSGSSEDPQRNRGVTQVVDRWSWLKSRRYRGGAKHSIPKVGGLQWASELRRENKSERIKRA
jgi:hypothetical protein